jgi:hypothetical protein
MTSLPEHAHREKSSGVERTSTPVDRSLPLKISSRNAIKQPFVEHTTTIRISCHGCSFWSKQFILKRTEVILEIPSSSPAFEPRLIISTVISSRKPELRGEPFDVDVAFEVPANVWDIAFPPEDWGAFTNGNSNLDAARMVARALGNDIRGNEDRGQNSEESHVLPIVPEVERFERTTETFPGSRRGFEQMSARLAKLEKQIAQMSSDQSPLSPVEVQLTPSQASQTEALSEASAALRREIEGAVKSLEQQIEAKMELLRETEERLMECQRRLDESLQAASVRARQAADECVGNVAREIAEITTSARTELLEVADSSIRKQVEKLNSEGTEVTQAAFDSMHKAAEWCQGKAQAGLQGHLDKTLERAAESLREQAAGACQLFASELDNYSRDFAAHTKKLVEESTKAQIENSGEQLKQSQKELEDNFEARLRRASNEYRSHLEGMTGVALDEAKSRLSELMSEQDSQFQLNAAQAVSNFQDQLGQCTATAAEDAVRRLETKFASLMETLRKETESQHAAGKERRGKELDESLAQFRQSLENVSNSWRATTVALLMQDSQKLKDKLAAGLMYGLQQSAVKGCVELAKILSQRSMTPAKSPDPNPPEEKNGK